MKNTIETIFGKFEINLPSAQAVYILSNNLIRIGVVFDVVLYHNGTIRRGKTFCSNIPAHLITSPECVFIDSSEYQLFSCDSGEKVI